MTPPTHDQLRELLETLAREDGQEIVVDALSRLPPAEGTMIVCDALAEARRRDDPEAVQRVFRLARAREGTA